MAKRVSERHYFYLDFEFKTAIAYLPANWFPQFELKDFVCMEQE